MEGKYAELQADQKVAQTNVERLQMETRLYNATHTQ